MTDTGRKFIGMEKDHEWFSKARERIEKTVPQISMGEV